MTDSATIRQKSLNAFGPILIKQGYEWVDLDQVASAASLEIQEIASEFVDKALLCEVWMEQTDDRARKHHDELLESKRPCRELLDEYFGELQEFMETHNFGGCPFTNTARAIRGQSEQNIEKRIVEHKSELRRFFQQLCAKVGSHSDVVAESLFLIYSGATVESSNAKDIYPVKAGRQAALSLFDLHNI